MWKRVVGYVVLRRRGTGLQVDSEARTQEASTCKEKSVSGKPLDKFMILNHVEIPASD
jgi:hypothetical protein